MKERPILMTGDSPRLILEGKKTQTRRVIKPQPRYASSFDFNYYYIGKKCICSEHRSGDCETMLRKTAPIYCPYGKVGDRLWVRENHIYGGGDYDNRTCYIQYTADDMEIKYKIPDGYSWDKTCKWCYTKLDGSHPIRPSIFMPRWASRILLEITGVRVERVQEISLEDCIKEGMPRYTIAKGCTSDNPPDPRWKFIELWDSINAKRGYGFDTNCWVWMVEFKVVTK